MLFEDMLVVVFKIGVVMCVEVVSVIVEVVVDYDGVLFVFVLDFMFDDEYVFVVDDLCELIVDLLVL